jgi:hypothetical protein
LIAAVPPHSTSVDVWGQPSRSAEVAGRPLGSTLHVFLAGKAVRLPRPSFHGMPVEPLSAVAARMHAPGTLALAKARRVGSVYLVPTTKGWVCVAGPAFATCHRGLLRSDVTYTFQSTATGIAVYGIAADGVARVSLGSQTATIHDNVFFLTRPMKLTSTAHLPKTFGTLTVSYRDGRPPARVALR